MYIHLCVVSSQIEVGSEELSQEERIARVKDFFSKSGSKGMVPPVIRPKPKPKPARKPVRGEPKENTTPTSPLSPGAAVSHPPSFPPSLSLFPFPLFSAAQIAALFFFVCVCVCVRALVSSCVLCRQ